MYILCACTRRLLYLLASHCLRAQLECRMATVDTDCAFSLQANPWHASCRLKSWILSKSRLPCRYLEMMMAMMVQLRCTRPLRSCSLCTMFWFTVSQCVSSTVYTRFCQTAPFDFDLVHCCKTSRWALYIASSLVFTILAENVGAQYRTIEGKMVGRLSTAHIIFIPFFLADVHLRCHKHQPFVPLAYCLASLSNEGSFRALRSHRFVRLTR